MDIVLYFSCYNTTLQYILDMLLEQFLFFWCVYVCDGVFSTVTTLWSGPPRNRGSVLRRDSSLVQEAQTGSGPTEHLIGIGCFHHGGKVAGT